MSEDALASNGQDGDAPASLRLTLWGDFRIATSDGETVRLRGRKAQALVAFLAAHPGKPFSRERLCGLLWGDRGEEQARASLRQVLSEIRSLSPTEMLTVDRQSVALRADAVTIDVDEIRLAAARGDQAALARLRPDHGDRFLGNLDDVSEGFDDWLAVERTKQEDLPAAQLAESEAASFGAVSATRSSPPAPSRNWRAIVAVLAVLFLVGLAAAFYVSRANRPEEAIIAVLPFEDLSGGRNAYLAEGISEEIMTQLSSDPAKTVVGRTSAWSVQGQKLDARTIGQRLGVNYLVEGSVRTAGEQVRVDVSLIRTKDGSRVWTERFSDQADNIFAMQDRIAAGISSRLRTGGADLSPPSARSASQTLYLTARGLVGTREVAKVETAVDVLRQAVARDPNFAPAWALLAKALIHQSRPRPDAMAKFAITPEARDALKRALQLDPRSADAHLALGMALGPGTDRRTAFERAVQLDPGNSETWAALAFDLRFTGEYEREYAAWRRAATIDPLWARAFFSASEAAWDLGLRKEAEALSSRASRENAFNAAMTRNDFGMRRGEFAAAFGDGRTAQGAASRGRMHWALLAQGRALRAMNLYEPARKVWPLYKVDDVMWRMWHNQAATPAEMVRESASFDRIWADDARATFLLATLLNAGRAQEAAGVYDALFKTPAAMAEPTPLGHAIFVRQAALVYLALQQTGRGREAAALRAIADAAVGRTLAQARVPNWYRAIAAQWQAASGERDAALASLERADREGWFYSRERDSFIDIALEPAFASLRGNARFERVRAHQRAVVAREAAKMRF